MNARTTASTNPKQRGSMMPTVVVALLPCCRNQSGSCRGTPQIPRFASPWTNAASCIAVNWANQIGSMTSIVWVVGPTYFKSQEGNARTTASMSPRPLGSMMPTAVVALLPCCRHPRQSARTTANTSRKLHGSMMPTVVDAHRRSWRSITLRHQEAVQAGVSMRGLARGNMIQIAEAAPERQLPTGPAQPVPATARMLAWRFGNTILTAKLASHCS